MIRLAVSAEGECERLLINSLIQPFLIEKNIDARAVILPTGQRPDGAQARGGAVSIDRIQKRVQPLLSSFDYVTTLYDYYKFKRDESIKTVDCLEKKIAEAVGSESRFIPYVQKYELEGLFFSDRAKLEEYFGLPFSGDLQDALRRVQTPEHLNDSEQTAPSKRLETWTAQADRLMRYTNGTKTRHVKAIVEHIGLPAIRAQCPRFNAWLTTLETLAERS